MVFNNYSIFDSPEFYKSAKIKRIYLQNCNKIVMNQVLFEKLKLNSLMFTKTLYEDYYLTKLMKSLKKSGFVSSIKIINFFAEDSKYITLNLNINPIVKKITILNYKKLQVPSKILQSLFKKQIGVPKNYHLINNSLKTIYLWYQSKGFAWVNIELIQENISNNLSFKVIEGVIQDTKITCQTHYSSNQELVNMLNIIIKKELKIFPGNILNIKTIEAGIQRLIDLNLIYDCNYIVKYNKLGLIVFIKYDPITNYKTYFYNYASILQNYFNNTRISNLLNLNKNVSLSGFLNKSLMFISKVNIYSSFLNINQYSGFKYQSFYPKNRINNLIIDYKIEKYNPTFDIHFSLPSINNQKNIVGNLLIHLYSEINKFRLFYPFLLLNSNNISEKQISNLTILSSNLNILLKHYLLKNMVIIEKILFHQNNYAKMNIKIKDYNIQYNSKFKLRIFNISKIHKNIKYHLINIYLSITYNTLYFWDQLKSGKIFQIYSNLFTFKIPQHKLFLHEFNYIGQNIGLKYIQVFNLPKLVTYIYYHAIIILFEFNILVSPKKYSIILQEIYNNIKNKYIKMNKNIYSVYYSFYLLKFEYHVSQYKYFSIYLLYNSTNYFYKPSFHIPFTNNTNILLLNETYIGTGLNFYIPIKKMPNIRLEFSIDNKGKNYFSIYTNSKYNE